jgi:hypothetical protein
MGQEEKFALVRWQTTSGVLNDFNDVLLARPDDDEDDDDNDGCSFVRI